MKCYRVNDISSLSAYQETFLGGDGTRYRRLEMFVEWVALQFR